MADFPLMVDCWMSLNVNYAIELARTCEQEKVGVYWWEECLHPDDFDGEQYTSEHLTLLRHTRRP